MVAPGFSETSALMAVLEQGSFTKAAERLGLSPARSANWCATWKRVSGCSRRAHTQSVAAGAGPFQLPLAHVAPELSAGRLVAVFAGSNRGWTVSFSTIPVAGRRHCH